MHRVLINGKWAAVTVQNNRGLDNRYRHPAWRVQVPALGWDLDGFATKQDALKARRDWVKANKVDGKPQD